jgi:hypothetical protein
LDTLRDIIYRGFTLNDASIQDNIDPDTGVGKGITGCVVESWDFSDVDIVQFIEKRARQDGMDAGDVYKGIRRLHMSGTLYGKTRALLYDAYWDLRAALDPVLAQRDEPADYGYQPLYFAVPTNRVEDYPTGTIEMRVLAMPRASRVIWSRDRQGGTDDDSLAIPWQATFMMKDPSIQGEQPQDYSLAAGGTVAGNFANRGNYIAVLNALIEVGPDAGTITIQAGGANNFVITVPASSGNRIIRVKGQDKLITFEEDSVETNRLGSTPADMSWPIIPPGTSGYTITFTGVTLPGAPNGSHMWFWETYA